MSEENTEKQPENKEAYKVLARKYRPQHFDQLIGQDALVRTLSNAIETGRIHHAYMLTGIRGTGKTTTARIIAKALNYTGADGKAKPTVGPTDDCEICQAITEDRHPDVMEMDAASRTGVGDIREILDGVRYAPTSARYKVYIIDEVHMLSTAAFNALLKTLEEPPEHVIFIFATTEIRKVPVTVLSRCQRFDLRRVDVPTLTEFYGDLCKKENVTIEPEALTLVAKGADGSVRDGLSLLDQAMALGGDNITAAQVQDMLGLADRSRVMSVLEASLKGDCENALTLMADLYRDGADSVVLIQDMLDLTHILTRLRAVPGMKDMHGAMAQEAIDYAADLAAKLSMPTLGRAWQILLKGLSEVSLAPNPQSAAEMVIIRLAYAADLPDPRDLLKKIKDTDGSAAAPTPVIAATAEPGGASVSATSAPTPAPDQTPVYTSPDAAPAGAHEREPVALKSISGGGGAQAVQAVSEPVPVKPRPVLEVIENTAPQPVASADIKSLKDIDAVLSAHREVVLAGKVFQFMHLVKIKTGLIEFRPAERAPQDLSGDLKKALLTITGDHWDIVISRAQGQATLAEDRDRIKKALREEVQAHPVVSEVIKLFPGTKLTINETDS